MKMNTLTLNTVTPTSTPHMGHVHLVMGVILSVRDEPVHGRNAKAGPLVSKGQAQAAALFLPIALWDRINPNSTTASRVVARVLAVSLPTTRVVRGKEMLTMVMVIPVGQEIRIRTVDLKRTTANVVVALVAEVILLTIQAVRGKETFTRVMGMVIPVVPEAQVNPDFTITTC